MSAHSKTYRSLTYDNIEEIRAGDYILELRNWCVILPRRILFYIAVKCLTLTKEKKKPRACANMLVNSNR